MFSARHVQPLSKPKVRYFRLVLAVMMILLTIPIFLGQHFSAGRPEAAREISLPASAIEDYQNGYFEDAKAALDRFVETGPAGARSYFLLAQSNSALGRPGEALAPLKTAVAKARHNPEYRYIAALHYRKLGQTRQAIDELKPAIKAWPEYIAARTLLAEMLVEAGNLAAARRHYRLVAKIAGSKRASSMADMLSANLILNKNKTQAQQLLRRALETDPDNQKAKELLGLLVDHARRLDAALWAAGLRTEITFPRQGAELDVQKIEVRGIAFSSEKIRLVEVSMDEGLTWHEAFLAPDGTEWSVPLILPSLAGAKLTLLSRARNELGQFEPPLKRTSVVVNNVQPRIEAQLRPGSGDLPGGFYSAPPKIYLTVEGGPGIIAYRWNRENYRIYESALTARRGENDLYYFFRDRRGKTGPIRRVKVKVIAGAG